MSANSDRKLRFPGCGERIVQVLTAKWEGGQSDLLTSLVVDTPVDLCMAEASTTV